MALKRDSKRRPLPSLRDAYITKHDLVLDRLRDAILDEELAPGQWLRLRDLAGSLGTSTMPIREALQVLAAEGLVIDSPHRGAQVADLSVEEFEEIYMARLGLEGLASRLGAERINESQLARMRVLANIMEQAAREGKVERFLKADYEFHDTHYSASGRPRLVDQINRLRRLGNRYIRQARVAQLKTEATSRFHHDLVDACERRDGLYAETLVRQDIDETLRFMRPHIAKHKPSVSVPRPLASADGV
jgi:DNA-binding GntR family transcriptional regulator